MSREKDVLSVRESFVPLSPNRQRTKRVFVARPQVKKDESVMGLLCAWIMEHQIGMLLNFPLWLTLLTCDKALRLIFSRCLVWYIYFSPEQDRGLVNS